MEGWGAMDNGHEEGIKGVDLGCGLRWVGVWVGMKYSNQTAPLSHCSGPLLLSNYQNIGRDVFCLVCGVSAVITGTEN